jgi:hypothetical protein
MMVYALSDSATATVVAAVAVGLVLSVAFVGTAAAQDAPDCGGVTYTGDGNGNLEVSTPAELQCIGNASTNGALDNDYVLTQDIDASGTSSWNGGDGFDPIGNETDPFVGSFDGNGNSVGSLSINRTNGTNVGMFGVVGNSGEVADTNLVGADVTHDYGETSSDMDSANVGALVGRNDGTVTGSSVGGVVSAPRTTGGLVGRNTGTVDGSVSGVNVLGVVQDSGFGVYPQPAGGLVGRNDGTVRESNATGDVVMGTGEISGGLVGQNNGVVERSASAGTVRDPVGVSTGGSIAGGLVGNNTGTVNASKAVGGFDGDAGEAGGLVGINDGGTVQLSYADVDINPLNDVHVGGLVGLQSGGTISRSYSTGDVEGGGNVNVQTYVGGLVGKMTGNAVIERSYAVGEVREDFSGFPEQGGLVGSVSAGSTVRESYWDIGTTGQDTAVDSGSVEASVRGFEDGDGLGRANAMTGSDPPDAGNMPAFEYVETGDPNPSWLLTKGYPVFVWDNTDAVDTPFFAVEITDTKASVQQGETLSVKATIENTRGGEGTHTVRLVYDTDGSGFESGTTVADTRQVDGLAAGSSVDVTLEDTVGDTDFAGGDFDNLQIRLGVETNNDIDLRTVDRDAEVEVAAVSSSERERDSLKTALDNGLRDAGYLGEYIVTPESAENVTGADAVTAVDEYDVLVVNDFGGVLEGEGTTMPLPDAEVEALYDEADADGDTRIVSLDMGTAGFGFGPGPDSDLANAITRRAEVLGGPGEVNTTDTGNPPVQIEITEDHPVFRSVGDTNETVNVYFTPPTRAWFDGYSGGVFGEIGEPTSNSTDGSAVGVAPDGNEVLLTLGGTGTVFLTPEGERILANAVIFPFEDSVGEDTRGQECIDRRDLGRGQEDEECPFDRDLERGETREGLDERTGRGGRGEHRDSATARRNRGR